MNKISIKLTYKDQIMNIVLPEELADKYAAMKLGTLILSAWDAMKYNADQPIPFPNAATCEAMEELHSGGGKKFNTFGELMDDLEKE